ncbi:MAG TPA: efflux RND transporter periplasmic adaptor subunit [Anaerolineae bacterium]|nr:efflux RND transporter periplasmic adaptor subunit [Anaerolineae bacterium]
MKRVSIIFVIALAAFLAACGQAPAAEPTPANAGEVLPVVVSASGKLMPERWATLAFQAGGQVVDVSVEAGDEVKAGDVLAQLGDVDARLAVAQAEAALAQAEAQLAQLKAGARPEEIAVAEGAVKAADANVWAASAQLARLQSGAQAADIAVAEAALAAAAMELKTAQDVYDRIKEIGGTPEEQARAALNTATHAHRAAQERVDQLKAGATKDELDVMRANLAAAQAQRDAAQAQLDRIKAGATPEQIAVAEAGVKQAQAALDTAKAQLAKLQVVAPFDGTVGAVFVREGESIAPSQPVVTLGDLSTLRVETTDLGEVDVARVQVGQPAQVTFDALPGATFPGLVTTIAPMSTPGQGGVNYTATIDMDEIDPALRWGMTAFVDIQVDR